MVWFDEFKTTNQSEQESQTWIRVGKIPSVKDFNCKSVSFMVMTLTLIYCYRKMIKTFKEVKVKDGVLPIPRLSQETLGRVKGGHEFGGFLQPL